MSERQRWGSKLGFVLAASGSAIGLGNIVFFSANAYTFGAGAFYLPYLLALFLIGIPVLIAELGLGGITQRGFPASMAQVAGKKGEFIGWWGLLNSAFIMMYYITILAWVCGMFVGAAGGLWKEGSSVPAFGIEQMANPAGYFFAMISSSWVIALVVIVWGLNLLICRRGVTTIEPVVKVFIPLMWIFMIILIVRGVTLPHGEEGVFLLFTPNFSVMNDPAVWQGAFSQIFFSLTLGFGVMTAYASYLPKDADQTNNGLVIACLNCGFEFVAGIAVFALLFAFAIVPQASTLAMMFFVVPEGIAAMPKGVTVFGLLFFALLLMAGLSSAISLIEAVVTAIIDKFRWSRTKTLIVTGSVGVMGSVAFAFPIVVDRQLASNGTVGLSLLDLIDHWAFSHGLLIVGLVECLVLGWVLPVEKIRGYLNARSKIRLPGVFDWLIKLVIPAVLASILAHSVWDKIQNGIYGHDMTLDWAGFLPWFAFLGWLLGTTVVAWILTHKEGAAQEVARG